MLDFLKKERKQAESLSLSGSKQKSRDQSNDGKRREFNCATGGGVIQGPKRQCLIHPNSNHFTCKCQAFLAKTVDERGSIVKDAGACKFCLSLSHTGQPCPFEATWNKCDIQGCNQAHSCLLHGSQIQGICCFVGEMCNKNVVNNYC